MDARFKEHIQGKFNKSYTKKANDWVIYFRADDLSYELARKIESHIKRMKSKKYIENLKAYPELLENLKLKLIRVGSSR